jgi:hypothetical protein
LVIFRVWRRVRAAAGAASPLVADEQAVGAAEAVVRRAWAEELLRRRDHAQFAVHAAQQDCEAAYRRVAAAQRDGDPRRIGLAHAALERAVEAVRASTLERDRVLQTLSAQLDLLARVARESVLPAPVPQREQDAARVAAAPREAPGFRAGQLRSDVGAAQREGRAPRWFGRLLARRAAALEQR